MAGKPKKTKNRQRWQQIPVKELHDALGRILRKEAQQRRYVGDDRPPVLELLSAHMPLLP